MDAKVKATLDRLVAEHEAIEKFPTAVELLREYEWVDETERNEPHCIACGGFRNLGHRVNCKVGIFLRELDAGRGGE